MGIEMIIGLATALLAIVAGAFGLGHARGTNKAEAKTLRPAAVAVLYCGLDIRLEKLRRLSPVPDGLRRVR